MAAKGKEILLSSVDDIDLKEGSRMDSSTSSNDFHEISTMLDSLLEDPKKKKRRPKKKNIKNKMQTIEETFGNISDTERRKITESKIVDRNKLPSSKSITKHGKNNSISLLLEQVSDVLSPDVTVNPETQSTIKAELQSTEGSRSSFNRQKLENNEMADASLTTDDFIAQTESCINSLITSNSASNKKEQNKVKNSGESEKEMTSLTGAESCGSADCSVLITKNAHDQCVKAGSLNLEKQSFDDVDLSNVSNVSSITNSDTVDTNNTNLCNLSYEASYLMLDSILENKTKKGKPKKKTLKKTKMQTIPESSGNIPGTENGKFSEIQGGFSQYRRIETADLSTESESAFKNDLSPPKSVTKRKKNKNNKKCSLLLESICDLLTPEVVINQETPNTIKTVSQSPEKSRTSFNIQRLDSIEMAGALLTPDDSIAQTESFVNLCIHSNLSAKTKEICEVKNKDVNDREGLSATYTESSYNTDCFVSSVKNTSYHCVKDGTQNLEVQGFGDVSFSDISDDSFVTNSVTKTSKLCNVSIQASLTSENSDNASDDCSHIILEDEQYYEDIAEEKCHDNKQVETSTLQTFIMESDNEDSSIESNNSLNSDMGSNIDSPVKNLYGNCNNISVVSTEDECDVSVQASIKSDNLESSLGTLSSGTNNDLDKNISLQVSFKSPHNSDLEDNEMNSTISSPDGGIEQNKSKSFSSVLDVSESKSCSSVDESCFYKTALDQLPGNDTIRKHRLSLLDYTRGEFKSCSSVDESCLYRTALDGMELVESISAERKSIFHLAHKLDSKKKSECFNIVEEPMMSSDNEVEEPMMSSDNEVQLSKACRKSVSFDGRWRDEEDENSSDDNFENFLQLMKKPGKISSSDNSRTTGNSSLDDFIVSDDDSELYSEEEDTAFYVTADRAILTSDKEDGHSTTSNDSFNTMSDTSDSENEKSNDKETMFNVKAKINPCDMKLDTKENKFFVISDVSDDDDDFLPSFRTPKQHIVKPQPNSAVPTITPNRPLPSLQGKTAPVRRPLTLRQETIKPATTVQKSCFSFLQSLSTNVSEYRRHRDAIKYATCFKKTKEELTSRLYKLFNETVFETKLPEDFSILWNIRLIKTAGYCAYKKKKADVERSARIELSVKVCDSAERLRDTLIHEMCHAAVWIFHGVSEGHGPYWKHYARKANRVHAELPIIMRCHNYKIFHKFIYKCTGCQYEIGRHSKSLDTSAKVCGLCKSPFALHVNSKDGVLTPHAAKTPRTPNKFAQFVKENYGTLKKERKGTSHKDVMGQLSKDFAAKNKITQN